MKFNSLLFLIVTALFISCSSSENPVIIYLQNSEIQYETEFQKTTILEALTDILVLSNKQLENKKYPDYVGNENQWDLQMLIYKYFVPDQKYKTLGDDFYNEVKDRRVRQIVEQFISDIENE